MEAMGHVFLTTAVVSCNWLAVPSHSGLHPSLFYRLLLDGRVLAEGRAGLGHLPLALQRLAALGKLPVRRQRRSPAAPLPLLRERGRVRGGWVGQEGADGAGPSGARLAGLGLGRRRRGGGQEGAADGGVPVAGLGRLAEGGGLPAVHEAPHALPRDRGTSI